MAPWEIWTYDFPVEGPHPCVIFTNAARLAHPAFDRINVLLCRTLRGPLPRELKPTEIILDRVDAIHFVLKAGLRERRGLVCKERRRLICQRMLVVFPFEF